MLELCVAPAVFRGVAERVDGLMEVHRLAVLAFGADRVEPIEFEPDGFDGEADWRAWAFRVSVHGVSVWAWAGYEIEDYGGVECAGCGVGLRLAASGTTWMVRLLMNGLPHCVSRCWLLTDHSSIPPY